MSQKKKFIWSSREYSLRDFVSELKYSLPLVVRVCEGYCSHDGYTYTFGADEEYRISHIKEQRRLVVIDTLGRRLSIPEEYPIGFFQLNKGIATSSNPSLLQELMDHLNPGIILQPEKKSRLQFWIGADKTMKADMDKLEIIDIYSDRYLVGNPVVDGRLSARAVAIPLFVNIKLDLAEGLLNGTTEDFHKVLTDLDLAARNYNNEAVQGNPEIMLYNENQAIANPEYAYIEPKMYISCAQAISMRTDVSPSKPLIPNPVYGQGEREPPPVSAKPTLKPNARIGKPLPPTPDETKHVQTKPLEKVLPIQATQMASIADEIKTVRLKPANVNPSDKYSSAPGSIEGKPSVPQRPHSQMTRYLEPMEKERYSAAYMDIAPDYPVESKPYPGLERDHMGQEESSGYTRMADVPQNFKQISVKGIAEILKLLHLEKYIQTFVENDIDGGLLLALNTDTMKDDLGMSQFDAIKLCKFVHEGWRPKVE